MHADCPTQLVRLTEPVPEIKWCWASLHCASTRVVANVQPQTRRN